jgi:hypothetical protein
VMWVNRKLILICLEIMLINMQDRCTVCVEREKASEIILGITDGTPGDVGQLEAHFGLLEIVLILTQERCPICAKHAIRSQIILSAPAGTPR